MTFTCPECEGALEVAPGYERARVECPLCGAIFCPDVIRTDDAVIDVHAEPADEPTRDSLNSESVQSTEPPADATTARRFHHAHDASQPRKIYIERRVVMNDSGCGCNGCGCLLLILVMLFFLFACQVVTG